MSDATLNSFANICLALILSAITLGMATCALWSLWTLLISPFVKWRHKENSKMWRRGL
jgi:hypothetical protein